MRNIFIITFCLISNFVFGATIYVTNINDNGTGSLRNAVSNASAGDIIRFDQNILNNGSKIIRLKSAISINKGIFIKGLFNSKDTLYFSGRDTNGIFSVNMSYGISYFNIHFDSMIFVHGKSTTGGAIFIDNKYATTNGYVYIRNCIFRDNWSNIGGAIGGNRSNGGSSDDFRYFLDIYNSDFINNISLGNGGAIGLTTNATGIGNTREAQCSLRIVNCNFMGNYAGANGGAIAIYAYASSVSNHVGKADIKVISCTLANNECKIDGGAVYCFSSSYSVNVTAAAKSLVDCSTTTIFNNKADGNGGAFYLFSTSESRLFTRKSTICKNYCLVDGSAAYLKSTAGNNVSTSVVRHYSYSSIYSGNYGNPNKNNTHFMTGGYSRLFECYGYNIFDVIQAHFTSFGNYGSNTDLFQKSASQIKLMSLQKNNRNTYTLIPDSGSVAINAGNKLDKDSAQNGPIKGIRDIGAGESTRCTPVFSMLKASICEGSIFDFNGKKIQKKGIYYDTIPRMNDCDSIVELALSVDQKSTPSLSISGTFPTNHFLEGSDVTYIAQGNSLGTNPNYQWYVNNVKVGTNSAVYASNNFKNSDKINCIAVSSLTCLTITTALSDTISMSVQFNNNEPCNAINLSVYKSCNIEIFTNSGATKSVSVANPSCAQTSTNDVWFKFAAPPSGNITFQTFSGFMTDAVISLYSGTCNNLVEIGCIDDVVNSKMPDGFLQNANPNTIYFARISRSAQGDGTFGICLHDQSVTNKVSDFERTKIKTFPNPVNKMLNIESEQEIILQVQLIDLLGNILAEYKPMKNQFSLEFSDINSSLYIIQIKTLSQTIQRFIKKQ